MKIQIVSDSHLEFSEIRSFFDSIQSDADVLVVAGDASSCTGIFISEACKRGYKHVLFVPGNHDFYGYSIPMVLEDLEEIKNKGFVLLNRKAIDLEGVRFVGATLWFRDDPMNAVYQRSLNDFNYIEDFEKHVYKENEKDMRFLEENVREGDIVITHHLPSLYSVHRRYKGSQLNSFFVCEMGALIHELKPAVWIHGHTHFSFDYTLGKTRVICNPRGYSWELNQSFIPNLTVEV